MIGSGLHKYDCLLAVKFARSTSDIQRAYDAAPGPPTKGVVQDAGPPSAPPAPPVDRTTSGQTLFELTADQRQQHTASPGPMVFDVMHTCTLTYALLLPAIKPQLVALGLSLCVWVCRQHVTPAKSTADAAFITAIFVSEPFLSGCVTAHDHVMLFGVCM